MRKFKTILDQHVNALGAVLSGMLSTYWLAGDHLTPLSLAAHSGFGAAVGYVGCLCADAWFAARRAFSFEIQIDRPKGHRRIFNTANGKREFTYPLDYGHFVGILNPQDDEYADVFVGSGGSNHGEFMKGRSMPDGSIEADEHKWYYRLTDAELLELQRWWDGDHDRGITWDWRPLTARQLRDRLDGLAATAGA